MNDDFLNLLDRKLDDNQIAALRTTKNAVIAAGAGSGKTQVLASRFAWLIITGQAKADQILTLTFTNKAAAEMYQRIYHTIKKFAEHEVCEILSEHQKKLAQDALKDFSSAHIQTLDSYCTSIVRQCANRYGIKPDFSIGTGDGQRSVKNSAFKFILQNLSNKAVMTFASPGKIQDFAENTFASIILDFTSLATEPCYFVRKFEVQKQEIVEAWNKIIKGKENGSIYSFIDTIKENLAASDKKNDEAKALYVKSIEKIIEKAEEIVCDKDITKDDIESSSLEKRLDFLKTLFDDILSATKMTGKIIDVSTVVTKLKNEIPTYKSIISFVNQYDALLAFNKLLDDFLEQTNRAKRISGNLSFKDVTDLALKILLENEDIRNQEKSAYKKIMIDEFQDNNGKNRDLLYILALKNGEFEQNGKCIIDVPENTTLHDLLKDSREEEKLFFVGDEKQSIYKFRGADVSVFNELTKDDENKIVSMTYNYRSDAALVKSFNTIFKNGNFIFENYAETHSKIDYEAYYEKNAAKNGKSLPEITAQNVPVHACIFDSDTETDVASKDQIAYFLAKKIAEIAGEKKNWSDFAILDKSRTDRAIITKYLDMFKIPYEVDMFKNIFSDGVVNDFYNFMRICVYPSDMKSFASYFCSPFCGLTENSVQTILSYMNDPDFDITDFEKLKLLEKELSKSEFIKLESAINFYKENKPLALQQKITTTVSYLWNEKGYKYETMLSEKHRLCAGHFDFLFELSRQADENGKNISWFIDQLDNLKNTFGSDDSDLDAGDISYPYEHEQAVHLMTIHKSKGLEFDHVFVYGCVNGKLKKENSDCFFDEKAGVSIKPENGNGNWFFIRQKDLAVKKEIAEFRRLIYVAITRAKKDIYIVGSSKLDVKSKAKCKLIEDLILGYYQPDKDYDFNPEAGFDFYKIPPVEYKTLVHTREKSTDELRKSIIATKKDKYAASDTIKYVSNNIARKTPSSLEPEFVESKMADADSGEKYDSASDVLKKSVFTAADFGTLAHSYLEMQTKGIKAEDYEPDSKLLKNLSESQVEKAKADCIRFCHEFEQCELGLKVENAKKKKLFIRAEWAFRMFYKDAIFTGSIDLIFENDDNSYTIVDYKSDNQIDESKYEEQQKAYRYAASKILKTDEAKISNYLYFLKHKKIVKL